MKLKLKPFLGIVFLVLVGCNSINTTSKPISAINHNQLIKDVKNQFSQTKALAEHGDATAQNKLGFLYKEGDGVKQDYNQAVYWFRKAAEQDFAPAQNNLGVMYEKGDCIKQDYSQAVYWFRKAAEHGNSQAQNHLGVMYYKGDGVKQDYSQSDYWLRKAAAQGLADAQYNIGIIYTKGHGVKRDKRGDTPDYCQNYSQNYCQAIEWFLKAAEQGYDPAKKTLLKLIEYSSY